MKMDASTFKPLFMGAVIGAAIMTTAGFWQLGWTTEGEVNRQVSNAVTDTYVKLLTPRCVETAKSQPEKLAEFGTKRWDSDKRKFVEGAGWLVYPDKATRGLKNALQGACTKELAKL